MSTNPVPPSILSTPRLHLVRLTDTSPGSQHVQWFHENWSDPVITGWSLHGATKSLEESQVWMTEHMTKWDNWFYAVFLHDETKENGLGRHIGSVSLRHQAAGPELLPPRTFDGAEQVGTGTSLSDQEVHHREQDLQGKILNLRVLGYAFFAHAQGKGYATEACKGLLDGYAATVREWKAGAEGQADGGKTVFYVEAGVDQDNPGSQRVLRKLGFRTVGLKIEKEKAWLNGAWRGPGWWITGMYL